MQVKIEVTFDTKEECFVIVNIPKEALTVSKALLSNIGDEYQNEKLMYCIMTYIDNWIYMYMQNVESWTEVEIIED